MEFKLSPTPPGQRGYAGIRRKEALKKYHESEKGKQNYKRNSPKRDRRAEHLRRSYNLTKDRLELLLHSQSYKCAICFEPITAKRSDIDHDHASNKVRGILCHYCNVGLGHFRDNVEFLRSAIRYRDNAKEKSS